MAAGKRSAWRPPRGARPVRRAPRLFTTPCREDLRLRCVGNSAGMSVGLLPNGSVFAIEHVRDGRTIMINQVQGSPVAAGMTVLYLRLGGAAARVLPVAGAAAAGRAGAAKDRLVWAGTELGVAAQVCLRLAEDETAWLWEVTVRNHRREALPCDAVLVQDLGLGEPGFVMANEAYASQYLDHQPVRDARLGHVLMSRQNLPQAARHPWVLHACLEGAVGFATDLHQITGPAHRDAAQFGIAFGTQLPSVRLQLESGCAALQSAPALLAPGGTASWTFLGLYREDHPAASGEEDLALIGDPQRFARRARRRVRLSLPARTVLQRAAPAVAEPLDEQALRRRYPVQQHREEIGGRVLSFFVPEASGSRHVVLLDKERSVLRRHGALLRSGTALLPDEDTLCVTCWMHGVLGASLTIGNTSFHRLLSISRDPYNITRGSGIRLLVDLGRGWRLLTIPSVFEMGLDECRWIYRLGTREITVTAAVSATDAAAQWRVDVEGESCRFLLLCHLALGEREFTRRGRVEIDAARKRFTFRPDPDELWSRHYPQACYYLVTSTPKALERVGGDELLYLDGRGRGGPYVALRSSRTGELVFSVVGSMTDPAQALELAARFAAGVDPAALRKAASGYWRTLTRGVHIGGADEDRGARALDTVFPWLLHDALVHLTVPHGLEQYTGGAWGTRDVCQGPMEMLLALEHDEPARKILHILFAQQYAGRGDWPQWFMLEPYAAIQDREAHGDVIVWPLKALCDYIEATGDFTMLEEPVPWRREEDLEPTSTRDSIAHHVAKLLATVQARFVPGTHLIRYGHGDWNDSLQPVDPSQRDRMVSSWTVALLYEQVRRYGRILKSAGISDGASEERLAAAMREDFNRLLMRDGTVAGYGVFGPQGLTGLLFHPGDSSTGVRYSLLPMTQAILGGLFTSAQTQHHIALIREHLSCPDGVRLLDRPLAYRGGPQVLFQRAESAAFFGREIGLMYVHAHLRYAQAMALAGDAQALWEALLIVNPIAVTERLAAAAARQRNCYFSSSDAAFRDRYQACGEWRRVAEAKVRFEGGWRVYSSGPGLYINLLVRDLFGLRREFGVRVVKPCLPPGRALRLEWPGRRTSAPPRR